MRPEPSAKGSDSSHLYCYFCGRKDLIAFLLTEHLVAAAQVIKTVSDTQPRLPTGCGQPRPEPAGPERGIERANDCSPYPPLGRGSIGG